MASAKPKILKRDRNAKAPLEQGPVLVVKRPQPAAAYNPQPIDRGRDDHRPKSSSRGERTYNSRPRVERTRDPHGPQIRRTGQPPPPPPVPSTSSHSSKSSLRSQPPMKHVRHSRPASKGPRRRSMKFVDSFARTCDVSKIIEAGIIQECNNDYLVVGVIGLAASGKSTVASALAGHDTPIKPLISLQAQRKQKYAAMSGYSSNSQLKPGSILDALAAWERKIPFRVQQTFTKTASGRVEHNFKASSLGMRPQTSGIDIFTTPERMIILDTPPLFSEYFTVTGLPDADVRNSRKKNSRTAVNASSASEYNALLNAAYIISWLQIVAHQIILVTEPNQILHPMVIEAIRLANMLLPKYEIKIRHMPELIIVENKATRMISDTEVSVLKNGIMEAFYDLHFKLNTAESRLYPSGIQTRDIISENSDLMAYENIELPQSNDVNFFSVSNWNEYLESVKNDYDTVVKNCISWSTGQKMRTHRINASKKFQEMRNNTEGSYFNIDQSYKKKFLSNPSLAMTFLRRTCASAPRPPIFTKMGTNQQGRQVVMKGTERDWLEYAQRMWVSLLQTTFYSDFNQMIKD